MAGRLLSTQCGCQAWQAAGRQDKKEFGSSGAREYGGTKNRSAGGREKSGSVGCQFGGSADATAQESVVGGGAFSSLRSSSNGKESDGPCPPHGPAWPLLHDLRALHGG